MTLMSRVKVVSITPNNVPQFHVTLQLTDFSVGQHCCVFKWFHKHKIEHYVILLLDLFHRQIRPQQHSLHYSCSLYLSSLSALPPLIMSQYDESDWSHYHADLMFILNFCCFQSQKNRMFVSSHYLL